MSVYLLAILYFSVLDTARGKCFTFMPCDPNKEVMLSTSREDVYPGDTVSVGCRVPSGDPANLAISVNDATIPSEVTENNESIAANVTISNEVGVRNVFCKETNSNLGCIDCKLLRVQDIPDPVVNVTCKVVDWTESMECRWDLGKQYKTQPNVTLQWRISRYRCGWNDCPDLDTTNTLCRWPSINSGDFSVKSLDLLITVFSGRDRTVKSHFIINTKNFIQPTPVDDLHSEALNSTCVQLAWTPNRKEYTKLYRVLYTTGKTPTNEHTVYLEDCQSNKAKNKTITICQLSPYAKYRFTVQAKPLWSDEDDTTCRHSNCPDGDWENATCLMGDGYWSSEMTSETQTDGAAPGKAPAVDEGGYTWDPKACSNGQNNRKVCVYWQAVDREFMYDAVTGYEVYITNEDSGVPKVNVTIPPSLTHYCVDVRCNERYHARVTTSNQFGKSPLSEAIQINDAKPGLNPPEFIVEMSNITSKDGDREVQVSWSNNTCTLCTYTIYTCKKDGGKCSGEEPVLWRNVSTDLNSFIFNLASPDNHLYGVSVNTGQTNSGFIWKSCIYMKDIAPSVPPDNVNVQPFGGGLLVSWNRQMCQPQQPYIGSYLIQYCPGANNTGVKCQEKEVPSKRNTMEITGLEEGHAYTVRLCSVAVSGQRGPWSDAIQKRTTFSKLDSGKPKRSLGNYLNDLEKLLERTKSRIKRFKRYIRNKSVPRLLRDYLKPRALVMKSAVQLKWGELQKSTGLELSTTLLEYWKTRRSQLKQKIKEIKKRHQQQ